jgi:hypothetical protein
MTITGKKRSQKQEAHLAKVYGGSVTPGSGNGWVHKNDVKTPTLSIEAKYTDAKSFSLKLADLIKAEKIALIDGRDTVFTISFSGDEFAILREEDYRSMRLELESLRNFPRLTNNEVNASRPRMGW